jgi:tetratricopeptide (TPR) repeat protein
MKKSGELETSYHLLVKNRNIFQFSNSITQNQKDLLYLFSIICIQLLKYQTAEKGLFILHNLDDKNYTYLYWLGVIMRHTDRIKKSILYFQQCLEMNPYMFSAYENICQLGLKNLNSILGGEVDPHLSFHPDKEIPTLKKYPPTTMLNSSTILTPV